MTQELAILVLAAGEGRRFDGIKQLATYGESTVLNHVIAQCHEADIGDVFVVLGAHFAEIYPTITQENQTIFHNADWQNGMGHSLAYGVKNVIKHGNYDTILIILADQPMISADFIRGLVVHFRQSTKSIISSKYVDDQIGPPVLFSKKYYSQLLGLTGKAGAKSIINEYSIDSGYIACPEGISLDIDTNEDYENLLTKS